MEKGILNDESKMVVIGGSAGSLKVILHVLARLKKGFSTPIVIVVHRKNDFESNLAELLAVKTGIKVKDAEDKETIKPNMIYLAPADYHLLIEKDRSFSLDDSEKINYSRPSIDATFQTAADAYGANLIAILLSGANADGVDGLLEVKAVKGLVAVQDPSTAQVPYMPQQAVARVQVDHILNLDQIADMLNNMDSGVQLL